MIGRLMFWRAALAAGVIAVVAPAGLYAQSVSGVIRSEETQQPVAGAQVSVEGTDLATLSNAQGVFQISGLEGDEVVLRVQVIGYQTVTVTVPVGSEGNEIFLPGTAIALDGIVVSALGISREARSLGYSVATVQPEQMTTNRTTNFMDALQGQMAGVNITSMAGAGPQASSRVRIRGLSSLGAHNSPLIVVNGSPIDNTTFGVGGQYDERGGSRNVDQGDGLASINPDDIVEMTVLKGAAGAALYGARAKDGVIMITTRNRADGTGVTFSYNSQFTVGTIHDRRNYQMEYGQGELGQRPTSAFPVTGVWSFGERFEPGMTQILFDGVEVPYEPQPNQLKEFYRNSYDMQNTVTAAYGSDAGGVSLSVSNLRSQAVQPGSRYERNTVNIGFTQALQRLTLSGNAHYAFEGRDNPPNTSNQDYSPVIMYTIANSMPMSLIKEKAMDEEGNEMIWSRFPNRTSPYFALTRFENTDRDRIFGNVTARYDFGDRLYLQGRVGQDYFARDQQYNLPTGSVVQAPAPPGFVNGSFVKDVLTQRELNAEILLGANHSVGDFALEGNIGANRMRRYADRNDVLVTDFFTRGDYSLANGRDLSPRHQVSRRAVNSGYGSLQVGYQNRMFVTATLRNDHFSTLSSGNRSIWYPSVATSFVVSELFQPPQWVDFATVRLAYAEVGSDTDVPPFADNLFYNIDSNFFHGSPLGSIAGNTVPDPTLRPMRVSEWEVGAEAVLFDNRLTLEVAGYHKVSTDQILNQEISRASGYTTQRINIGESWNRGIETLVSANLIRGDRLGWTATLNNAYNTSRIVDLGSDIGVDEITTGTGSFHGNVKQITGLPMAQVVGWGWRRNEEGRIIHDPNTGLPMRSEEQVVFGSAIPNWVGGINNRFTYRDLSASFLIDWKLGHVVASGTHVNAYRHGLAPETLRGRDVGCVVGQDPNDPGVLPDGSENDICVEPQAFYEVIRTHTGIEQSVFSGSNVQLRQVSVGYDLTRHVAERLGVSSVRLNLVASNVAVLKADLPAVHPDQNAIISDNQMGLESTGIPVTRNIGVNISMRF